MSEIQYKSSESTTMKKVTFNISIDSNNKIDELAKKSGLSKSALVDKLIQLEFERYLTQR